MRRLPQRAAAEYSGALKRSWAIAIIALWILMAVAMNIAFAAHAAPSPEIPMDHLVDALV